MQPPAVTTSDLPAPRVRGDVDVAQGVYGQRGNLELIAPDEQDGFVVLWFNGDDDEPASGPPRRAWSPPLHVPTGGRLDAARIAQVPFGPDFLEAVVQTGTRLERWTWRPGPGFVDAGALGTSTCTPSAPVATADALHLLTADGTAVLHHRADARSYPEAGWTASAVLTAPEPITAVDLAVDGEDLAALVVAGRRAWRLRWSAGAWGPAEPVPGAWSSARLAAAGGPVVGRDADGRVVVGDRGGETVDAVAAVRSSLDGGTVEVVARRGDALLHARVPAGGGPPDLVPIRPRTSRPA